MYSHLPNSRAGTGRRCSSIWHSAREGPRVPNAEIENPARLLERQKMPAACRPKNEAANFIFPPWIRLFFRYPCVPPTPLQLSSVAMTSHTSLDGVPGAWRQTLSTAVSCLEEGRAARGEVLRRVVWRTAMTSHTSLDGVPGAWRQTLSTAVSCLEEGRAARGEVLRRVVWRTAMTSHSLDGVPGAAWLVWRGEGVVCLQHTRSVYSSLFQSPLQVVAVRLDKLAVFVVGGETARWS